MSDYDRKLGGSIFDPWNSPMRRDDPFAPWNDQMKRSDPFACWNDTFGHGSYEDEARDYR